MNAYENKRTEFMKCLRKYNRLYFPLWDEWLLYKGEKYITQEELYALDVYAKNNFNILKQELVMFYYKSEVIEQILLKLKTSKKEFKEWVLDRWMFSLLKIGLENDLTILVETPIDALNICEELKISLRKFKKKSLGEIFDSYNNKGFMEDYRFNIILDNMTILKKTKNNFNQPIKKEVLTLNWN